MFLRHTGHCTAPSSKAFVWLEAVVVSRPVRITAAHLQLQRHRIRIQVQSRLEGHGQDPAAGFDPRPHGNPEPNPPHFFDWDRTSSTLRDFANRWVANLCVSRKWGKGPDQQRFHFARAPPRCGDYDSVPAAERKLG